ncbi:hypothetical protein BU16DRAFT_260493 [Lophium mytilinum]|uniref:Heterokaryon incompatibility domain-containing protein n=1 Tax=Lophium mytilinum TaxID=390894 RepID=A0A6A6RAW4_9PEZI|nr:hypothetical protein BU16DRAFT_260493 [Lophium mytilinum]
MLPYDWETDPWNWLEHRSGYSCLRLDYSSLDWNRAYGERRRAGLRLVRIEPGAAQDPLRCSLISLDFESIVAEGPDKEKENAYEAISYVWGSTDDLVPVRCKTDGLELDFSYSWIAITKNCAEVIRHLRLLNKPRQVWIDAICIDQADAADRAHYVRRMHHIYRDAERVTIVLPNYMKAFGQYWAESEPGLWIFTHPYFTRIWILQEVFWGRNPVIYAGQHELQWSEVCSLYHPRLQRIQRDSFLSKEAQISVELVLAMGTATTKSISRDSKRNSLLELYRMSKAFEATDQRDKLIALISMATDVTPQMEAILVDYTVAYDVLLRRFAAAICFRSLKIMPGIERGIDMRERRQDCMNKIDKFMALSTIESSDLIKMLCLRTAERYVCGLENDEASIRQNISAFFSEEFSLSLRRPLRSIFALGVGVLAFGAVMCFGIDRLDSHRSPGSQSRKMTVSELLGIIEESKALVQAASSDDQTFSQLQRKGQTANPTARDERIEDKTTVRVVIMTDQHLDLYLVPGDVNAFHRRCKRAWVDFNYDPRNHQSDPIPLLLRESWTGLGRDKVLGPFYDIEPLSRCWHVPLVKHIDSKPSRASRPPNTISIVHWDGQTTSFVPQAQSI